MITDVRDRVKDFLKETIEADSVRVVRVDKAEDGGWVAEAEVSEMSQYLASIKPEYRVFEKEQYIVKLDASLEVFSYKRIIKVQDEQEDPSYDF